MVIDPSTPARTLSDLLEVQALVRPDSEGLTDGRRRLNWSEYAREAGSVAATLADLGVRRGDRVAVHLLKSVESFVAVHAILRLGAVVVPVDWFASPHYARNVLRSAGARAVVSGARSDRLEQLLDGSSVEMLVNPVTKVEAPGGIAAASGDQVLASTPMPPATVTPDDPAYIVFTSGSTGRPKGIVHTHDSALAYARRAVDTYGITPSDRLANIAPLHFDQSTFELYAGPLAGAAVLVVPDGVMKFPASMSKLIADERITVWYSVPYAARQLAERGALDERDLSTLRWVLFGGESFPAVALADLMRRLPHTRFSNVYGPAEVNQCTYFHLDQPPAHDSTVPIGRPWADTETVIVDESESPVTNGPGELWVASPTMMSGYWDAPDLTAAAIVERDDLGSATRWYRTGDLIERRLDDNFVFLGRLDNQVKVRGYRVELEAIETVFGELARVQACSVVVEDGERIIALVVAADLDPTAALQHARQRLPAYAVPHEIITVGTLPRTGTGKIDRNAATRLLTTLRESSDDG